MLMSQYRAALVAASPSGATPSQTVPAVSPLEFVPQGLSGFGGVPPWQSPVLDMVLAQVPSQPSQ